MTYINEKAKSCYINSLINYYIIMVYRKSIVSHLFIHNSETKSIDFLDL